MVSPATTEESEMLIMARGLERATVRRAVRAYLHERSDFDSTFHLSADSCLEVEYGAGEAGAVFKYVALLSEPMDGEREVLAVYRVKWNATRKDFKVNRLRRFPPGFVPALAHALDSYGRAPEAAKRTAAGYERDRKQLAAR
jgi:hypothetical protein